MIILIEYIDRLSSDSVSAFLSGAPSAAALRKNTLYHTIITAVLSSIFILILKKFFRSAARAAAAAGQAATYKKTQLMIDKQARLKYNDDEFCPPGAPPRGLSAKEESAPALSGAGINDD